MDICHPVQFTKYLVYFLIDMGNEFQFICKIDPFDLPEKLKIVSIEFIVV